MAAGPDRVAFQWLNNFTTQGVLVTDDRLTIIGWNNWLETHSGHRAAEMIGRSLLEAYPELVTRRLDRAYEQALAGQAVALSQRVHRYVLSMPAEEGGDAFTVMQQNAQITPLMEDGRVVGTITIIEDVSEHVLAAEQWRQSEARLRTVLEHMPIMLDALDENLNIIVWNRECERVTGYSADEIIHHPHVSELLYPDPLYRERMQGELAMIDDYRGWEWETTCKDGSVRTIAWFNISRQYPVPGWAAWGIGVDITERKRAEEAEREQRALAEALRDVAAALNSTLNQDEVLDRILANVERVLPHDASAVFLVEGDLVRVMRHRGVASFGETLQVLNLPLSSLPDLQWMAATRQPYTIPNVHLNPDWVDIPETRWMNSYVGAPLCTLGQVIGFVCLYSAVPDFYDQDDGGRLQAFADLAATAIRNAQLFDTVVHYATELEGRVEERTAELNQEKERVEAILNGSSDAILLTAPDGAILRANPAFEHLFGVAGSDQQAISLLIYVDPQHRAALQEALGAVVQDCQPRRLEVAMRRPDGAAFDADVALSPITSGGSAMAGVVCSLRDITARKQMERHLRGNLERERELNQLKSRFITTVSHEFRTPLAVIQASSDLLKRYSDRLSDEQRKEEIEQIQTGIRRMVELIEDVLNLNRLQSGLFKFSPIGFDVVEFCQGLIREFQTTDTTGHQFAFSVTGTGSAVEMDNKLLRHILGNLVSNAVKYSPSGSTVYVDLTLLDAQSVFKIRDEGIGIPQPDVPRLFEAFFRAENADTVPGSGLGLAIVKQAVELQGGTITVESAVGAGTTFTVILPTVADQAEQEEPGIY